MTPDAQDGGGGPPGAGPAFARRSPCGIGGGRRRPIAARTELAASGLSLAGTLGAFIRIRGPIPHRKALFDIGIAGPLAGFALALPVLILGGKNSPGWFQRSVAEQAAATPGAQLTMLDGYDHNAPPEVIAMPGSVEVGP